MPQFRTLVLGVVCFSLCLFTAWEVRGQKVVIIMRDSSRVITRLRAYSDHHLHASAGIYELSKLYAVKFEAKDEKKSTFFLDKLLSSGVTIFIGNKRLNPTAPYQPELPADEVKESPITGREGSERARSGIGLGAGLDYGGVGVRISYLPFELMDVFFAGGYALADVGMNGGLVINLMPKELFTPTISVMYGYNAAISISGSNAYDKMYYGPSLGAGFKVRSKKKMNFFHLEAIIPFRSADYDRDIAAIKSNPSISTSSFPGDILISIGYHFGFGRDN